MQNSSGCVGNKDSVRHVVIFLIQKSHAEQHCLFSANCEMAKKWFGLSSSCTTSRNLRYMIFRAFRLYAELYAPFFHHCTEVGSQEIKAITCKIRSLGHQ